jgi:hypothetical protein
MVLSYWSMPTNEEKRLRNLTKNGSIIQEIEHSEVDLEKKQYAAAVVGFEDESWILKDPWISEENRVGLMRIHSRE